MVADSTDTLRHSYLLCNNSYVINSQSARVQRASVFRAECQCRNRGRQNARVSNVEAPEPPVQSAECQRLHCRMQSSNVFIAECRMSASSFQGAECRSLQCKVQSARVSSAERRVRKSPVQSARVSSAECQNLQNKMLTECQSLYCRMLGVSTAEYR